jgi:hypothetical protein
LDSSLDSGFVPGFVAGIARFVKGRFVKGRFIKGRFVKGRFIKGRRFVKGRRWWWKDSHWSDRKVDQGSIHLLRRHRQNCRRGWRHDRKVNKDSVRSLRRSPELQDGLELL